jgi:excisionase family DNA binding protein
MPKQKPSPPPAKRETLTAKEAAEIVGISRSALLRYVKRGWIRGYKKGLGLRSPAVIYKDSLDEFLEKREVVPEKK